MAVLDTELEAAVSHTGRPGVGNVFRSYKEVQVHGPVRFREDVQRLVADINMAPDVIKQVERFAQANDIKLEWRMMGQRFTELPANFEAPSTHTAGNGDYLQYQSQQCRH